MVFKPRCKRKMSSNIWLVLCASYYQPSMLIKNNTNNNKNFYLPHFVDLFNLIFIFSAFVLWGLNEGSLICISSTVIKKISFVFHLFRLGCLGVEKEVIANYILISVAKIYSNVLIKISKKILFELRFFFCNLWKINVFKYKQSNVYYKSNYRS